MVNFKENYHFSRFLRGPTFSRGGGSNFFQGGGVQLLIFPIETHTTCDFPWRSGPPVPHQDLHLCIYFEAAGTDIF